MSSGMGMWPPQQLKSTTVNWPCSGPQQIISTGLPPAYHTCVSWKRTSSNLAPANLQSHTKS